MLLGAVVNVAFQPAPRGVLCGDDPGARRLQLGGLGGDLVEALLKLPGQLHVAKDDPSRRREIGEHLFIDWRDGFAASLSKAEPTEHLALVLYRDDSIAARDRAGDLVRMDG